MKVASDPGLPHHVTRAGIGATVYVTPSLSPNKPEGNFSLLQAFEIPTNAIRNSARRLAFAPRPHFPSIPPSLEIWRRLAHMPASPEDCFA